MQLRRYNSLLIIFILLAVALFALANGARGQGAPAADGQAVQVQTGPGFTYQGRLMENGAPINGTCEIFFALMDAVTGGNQIGQTVAKNDVTLIDGRFTVILNTEDQFGPQAFTGDARWLQIQVRCPPGVGEISTLSPRQPLTAAPYAQGFVPGAAVNGAVTGDAVLNLTNTGAGDGLRVADAGVNGISVLNAGLNGVEISHSTNAFWAGTPTADGLYVQLAGFNGLDVSGFNLAGYFGGPVQITGGCTGCLLANFGRNASRITLEPGDVVVLTGSQISSVDSVPLLLDVAPADGQGAVIGVVIGRAEEVTVEHPRPSEKGRRLIPREGPAKPGEFVTIATYGLAHVRIDSQGEPFAVGQRLTAGRQGAARALQTVQVNTVPVNEAAPVLGIALEAGDTDGDGLVWMLVNPQ